MLVFDDEYEPLLEGVELPRGRWRAWTEEGSKSSDPTLDEAIDGADTTAPPKPGTPPGSRS